MKRFQHIFLLFAFTSVTISWIRQTVADDVFYAASSVDSEALGTTPKSVTMHGRPEKVIASFGKNDVIIRHNLEKNERVEILRVNDEIQSFSVSAKGDRLTYMFRTKQKGNRRAIAEVGSLDGTFSPDGKSLIDFHRL